MITFKPVVNYRRRDGTYAVRIRVTFRRQHRYLATTITAYPQQLTRSLRLKDPALIAAAEGLVRDLREVVSQLNPFTLEGKTVDWVVAWIRQQYRRMEFRLDFFEFAERWLEGKKPQTAENYRSALRAFSRFIGRGSIDINDIDRPLLASFLRDAPVVRGGAGANARYLSLLSAIFSAARSFYNDGDQIRIPRTPFDGLDLRKPPAQGQDALPVEVIQKIIDARPESRKQAVALATFVVSFGTMGANHADLYDARSFRGDTWKYNRQKTRDRRADHAKVLVEIDPRLRYHLSILQEGGGEWWLPAIHRQETCNGSYRQLSQYLYEWEEAEGLPHFTIGATRHSWATIARSIGVEKATVDEGLAHVGDFRVADIYAERDWRRINDANRRVLDLFSWEGCGA